MLFRNLDFMHEITNFLSFNKKHIVYKNSFFGASNIDLKFQNKNQVQTGMSDDAQYYLSR